MSVGGGGYAKTENNSVFKMSEGKFRQHSYSSLEGKDYQLIWTAQYESQSILIQCAAVATY